jgi:hypothetical protein
MHLLSLGCGIAKSGCGRAIGRVCVACLPAERKVLGSIPVRAKKITERSFHEGNIRGGDKNVHVVI